MLGLAGRWRAQLGRLLGRGAAGAWRGHPPLPRQPRLSAWWCWGLGAGLGLALRVKLAAAAAPGGPDEQEEPPPPRKEGFVRAAESCRDLLQRVKVGWEAAGQRPFSH